MIISQKRSKKTPGIGTELYVYKEDELTEEDQAEIYTKWTAFAGSLSVSPLLLNTEEAKTDEDSENIRIRVWEKLSSELTDLTVFDKSEPKPGIPRRNHIYKGERIMDDSFLAGLLPNTMSMKLSMKHMKETVIISLF